MVRVVLMTKISIVIPTRNRIDLIERAVLNAIIHKNVDFEVILSENGSSDQTWEKLTALKKIYSKIKIIKQTKLLDLSEHWDNIIKNHAEGEFILLLPDDDIIIDANYLSHACEILDQRKSVSVVFSRYHKVDSDEKIIGEYKTKWPPIISGNEMLRLYNSGNDLFIPHLTAVFRRSDYDKVAGFNSAALSPDMFLWLKLTSIGDFAFIDRPVAHYMLHSTNFSNDPNPMLQIRDLKMIKLVEIYFDSINHLGTIEKKHLKRLERFVIRKYHSRLIKNLLFNQKFKLKWWRHFNLQYFVIDYILKGIKVKIFRIGSI